MSRYSLQLPDHVMEQARRAASEEGISVDRLFEALVSDGLESRRGLATLHRRAARADVPSVRALLDRAPDVPAEDDDALDDVSLRARGEGEGTS